MKRLLIILAVSISLFSCEKTYDCIIETTYMGTTSTTHYEFTGTSKEMKEFEESATSSQNVSCE